MMSDKYEMDIDISFNLTEHLREPEEGELEDDSDCSLSSHGRIHKFSSDLSKSNDQSIKERAIHFELENEESDKELQLLYQSLSIITEEDIRHTKFDTIHMKGTEKLNTTDIFGYFYSDKPIFLEWIDENSCDVVWKDNISAARAMILYSKTIKYPNVNIEMNELYAKKIWTDAVNFEDINVNIPPGHWRLGISHPKSQYIFLRFGNKSVKKLNEDEKLKLYSKKYNETIDSESFGGIVSESMKSKIKAVNNLSETNDDKLKNPWGDLCKTWGINDSQEIFRQKVSSLPDKDQSKKSIKERIGKFNSIPENDSLILNINSNSLQMRLGKRPIKQMSKINSESENESDSSNEEWKTKSKIPRMRMHADDEEKKIVKHKLNKITDDEDIDPQYNDKIIDSISLKERLGIITHVDKIESKIKSNIYSRLGKRYDSSETDDSQESLDNSKNEKNSNSKPKVVKSTISSCLIDTQKEENSLNNEKKNDLRYKLLKQKKKTVDDNQDLRGRISKKNDYQRSVLRIEFENDYYSE